MTLALLGLGALVVVTIARLLEDHPLVTRAADWLIARDVL